MAVLGIAWVSTRDPNEISTNISHSNSRVIGPRWFVGNRKKPWSFAPYVVRRDHVNRARNADHTTWTCERFVSSIVKVARLYDYQTWRTHFGEIHEVRKGLWAFFLDCAFRLLIGWATKLRSRGGVFPRVLWGYWWFQFCSSDGRCNGTSDPSNYLSCPQVWMETYDIRRSLHQYGMASCVADCCCSMPYCLCCCCCWSCCCCCCCCFLARLFVFLVFCLVKWSVTYIHFINVSV